MMNVKSAFATRMMVPPAKTVTHRTSIVKTGMTGVRWVCTCRSKGRTHEDKFYASVSYGAVMHEQRP